MEAAALPSYFGEWLKHRRKALDLTQAELAQRAGCSVFAVRKIESGERRPSKQLAGLLAQALEIPSQDQPTFIRVARGELNLERLPSPNPAGASTYSSAPKPISPPNNLPVMPTLLVGRQPELASLERLLGDPHCRLLTLVGPGGVGKTRLAVEVAGRQANHFAHGVNFVPLAALTSPAYLIPAIASAVGCVFQGQVEPRLQLLNYLAARQMLLLVDNLEHLLEGVDLLAELLKCAPGLKLLVTSRERLNLQSEWVFEVQGLPVPASGKVEHPEAYSSLALFAQRARQARADFELEPEDLPFVVQICQMMEGLPLGIELAAVWVSTLTCGEIAQEIERSMDFLATSMRDLPDRQRSLRAAFDHSWKLLSEEERAALTRLSVFRGGFDRQAAEQVAGASLPLLLALVSKSLLRRTESGRFDLHEVIRQYALSHLVDDAEGEAALDRHSDFYLSLLRDRETDLKGTAQRQALQELKTEISNVRAAWGRALGRGNYTAIGQALRSFALLFDLGGWLEQGSDQLEAVVQALRTAAQDESRQKILGQALTQQGLLLLFQGQHVQAQNLLEEGLTILRPIGDPALLPEALIRCGTVYCLRGEFGPAQTLVDEGLACAQAAGDPWFIALGMFNQGYIANIFGHHAQAHELMHAAVATWRALDDSRFTAMGLNFLAYTAVKLGCYEEADSLLKESLALCMQLGDRWGIGTAQLFSGLLALAREDLPAAHSLFLRSLDLYNQLGTRWEIAQALIYLGETATTANDRPEAGRTFSDALPIAVEIGAWPLVMSALVGLARLYACEGAHERALMLSICVLNHATSTHGARDRAAQLRMEIEPSLGPEGVESARQQAQNKTLNVLVEELLVASGAAGTVRRWG
jgi:predicted ATPase/transcriptional regulator with XRE-family HTH domain